MKGEGKMGTRADFYAGREWLGSLGYDGYRIHEMDEAHAAKSEDNGYCWRMLMGFPRGWLNVEPPATPSSRKSPSSSAKRSSKRK